MRKILFIIPFFLISVESFSHNVKYSIIDGGKGVKVYYSDGTPLVFAEVKIYSPANPVEEFQTGFTDKNGIFMFYPDMKGKWRIEINDGSGHGIVEEIDFDKIDSLRISQVHSAVIPVIYRIFTGIGIVWGITGLWFYFKVKKMVKNKL